MLIANQKLRENIAEYILYMWQVENIVRSLNFDINEISKHVINVMTSNEDAREDVAVWYEEIITEMKQDGLVTQGHLRRVNFIQEELVFLHNTLLTKLEDSTYKELFAEAYSYIEELRAKSQNEATDIEVCLTALYGKLMLKVQGKEISEETELALSAFTRVLAYLSKQYKEFKSGNLKFQLEN